MFKSIDIYIDIYIDVDIYTDIDIYLHTSVSLPREGGRERELKKSHSLSAMLMVMLSIL